MASISLLKKCQNWVYDPDGVVFELGLYCFNGILLYSEEKQQDFFGCLARFLGCPGLREADNPEI